MEIFVEKQPNCLASLRATIPSVVVKAKLDKLAEEYRKEAKLPGFRPGKAPVAVVARKYRDAIEKEAVKELLREAVDKAAKDNGLRVLNAFDLKHGEVADKDLDLTVQLTLEPEFTLPDVENLDVEVLEEVVTDDLVEQQIKLLLERLAEFDDVKDRPLQMGDYAVLDYDALADGKPLAEICPEAPSAMKGGEGLWIAVEKDGLLPGFCEGLTGMEEGGEKRIEVTVPEDFFIESLRGKQIAHNVKLKGIKAKKLPEFTDEVAKEFSGHGAEEFRKSLRETLEGHATAETERKKRAAAVEHLVKSIEFETPVSFVMNEARRVVEEIVEAEQSRGLSNEDLLSKKDEIFQHAQMGAQFRVRADFILTRLARERKIEASREDLLSHIEDLSRRLNMPVDKLVKQLVKRDGLDSVQADVVRDKALDFLASKVRVKKPADKA